MLRLELEFRIRLAEIIGLNTFSVRGPFGQGTRSRVGTIDC